MVLWPLLVVLVGLVLSPEYRCRWFGRSCPSVTPMQLLSTDEEEARKTRECVSDVTRLGQLCFVSICIDSYLRQFPTGHSRDEFDAIAEGARVECDSARQGRIQEEAPRRAQDEALQAQPEDSMWQSAQQCARNAATCVVQNCYWDYLDRYRAPGSRRAEAEAAITRAEQSCLNAHAMGVANGRYLARSDNACGTKPSLSINVTIRQGQIAWEHEFRGTAYGWSGTIDSAGVIEASVGSSQSFRATGRYGDEERMILMRYPQCALGVNMDIVKKIGD
ncbi:hypothetical protein RZS28_00705 [Methylocapsa polymorpha]|uniref:Lysozyme inhibitor LprI N-terminal domain-containing protein n=1 Tax=Methylocapsa polymorpha TaxID=3080828 RepID=A0ABZ0HTY6_9HYPH|nr:hypothetical protein RZS28_00705 [Methylocapsa sp. RX1]